MNEEAISYIMQKMSNCLDNSQMIRLEKTLFLYKFNIGKILEKYLLSRNDDNPALFVTISNPRRRLKTGGVEIMLKKMGEQCEVKHVHPHKFRRTMATTAIDRGMPIKQVQKLLGHEKIDTTLTCTRW